MPSYKLDENPPAIWPEGSEIADLAATTPIWIVIESHYNCEKKMAFELCERRIPYYLPLVKKRDDWRRLTFLPLFPRFLFAAVPVGTDLRFDDERKRPARYLSRTDVAREDWILVRELHDIKTGIESGRIKSLDDLAPGQLARVIGGSFRGIEATIDRIDRRRGLAFLNGPNREIEVALAEIEAA